MSDSTSDDSRPVFPRLLAGGPEQWRLSRASMVLLAGYAAAVTVLQESAGLGPDGTWPLRVLGMAGTIAAAVLTAAIAARWLGSRLAVAAGIIQPTGLHVLGLPLGALWSDPWIGLLTAVVMAAFGWGNVSGRLSPVNRPSLSVIYSLGTGLLLICCGWAAAAGILLACMVYVLLNQDRRAFYFQLHPLGLTAFGLCVGFAAWWGDANLQPVRLLHTMEFRSVITVALGMLPWSPLCVLAVAVGCRRGHYATAFWQFVACWSLWPLVLAAAGLLGDRSVLAMTVAPLSILAAAGLYEVVLWRRRISLHRGK